MAREIRSFAVTVTANTAQATPATTSLSMPARYVRKVRIRVPPGPRGAVGFALGSSGQRVIPWGAGQWIVADDEALEWELEGQIESGAWQLQAYNTGVYDHTLYVTFELDPLDSRVPAILAGPVPL